MNKLKLKKGIDETFKKSDLCVRKVRIAKHFHLEHILVRPNLRLRPDKKIK